MTLEIGRNCDSDSEKLSSLHYAPTCWCVSATCCPLRNISEQIAGESGQVVEVMGAAQHGFTLLRCPVVHEAEYLAAVVHIELLGRLIKQVNLGILQAELSQPHQLLLATGELGEVADG